MYRRELRCVDSSQFSLLLCRNSINSYCFCNRFPTIVRCSAKPTIPHSLNTQQHHYSVLFHKFQLPSLLFNVFMSIGFNFIIVFEQLSVAHQRRQFHNSRKHSNTTCSFFFNFNFHYCYLICLCRFVLFL
jgi:hypothetical protein